MEQRWRGIKTWHFPPSLSPNLLEAASPPLGGKKNPTKGRGEEKSELQDPQARARTPAPARPLGAQDGWALKTHPARLARPGPAAAGWLRPQPGAFQAGAVEAEKKRKWGGRGGGAKGEGRAGGGEGREPSLLFISS